MKLKYIAAFAFAVALASCDILDKEPSDSWDSGSAIQTVDDLKYAINGIYETQTGNVSQFGNYTGDFGLFADLKGSDYKCVGGNNMATEISRYLATSTGNLPDAIYQLFYKSIARTNKVMEQAQAAGLTGDEVNACLGELYALRALFHFDLARVYAQLPTVAKSMDDMGIVLATKTFDYTFVPERATLKQTYETILADLDEAIKLMEPIESTHDKNNTTGHMNYWAALALRARVNLYLDDVNVNGTTEHNKLALADAKKIIEEGPYSLYKYADYTSVWAKEFTDESIFEFQTTSQYNPQRNSLGYYTDPSGYAEAAMSDSFVEDFVKNPAYTKDIRVSSGMIMEESYGPKQENKAFYTQKYPGRDGQIYVNNAKVFRLSEIYLIAAEAALKTNDETAAAKYIDDLRKERIADYVAGSTASVTIEDILTERRLELNGEGHMAWDMWRNGKSINNPVKGEVKPGDNMAVFPIPQANINASHGALKQNPGF
ncbi:RagB/SusD family nutrient uptake outer membrane protein [Phocaeicola sp. KGMB11183]|uniref:RagB/SusD family nutrient uptake outer membrane protein n=1 Tax=Phocaeicola acetigenes TaxID=3016083 RepID=A0ABT4PHI9_9BACT|nr:RagB/SusD family nutrient uptake outer membrane protein [Phocaeicola sp. KGMB11183]MCZ8372534.1 RagB/SusD family nutrient uptake outer membrane protein [Phocaeicola sp. KGMB11183]